MSHKVILHKVFKLCIDKNSHLFLKQYLTVTETVLILNIINKKNDVCWSIDGFLDMDLLIYSQ